MSILEFSLNSIATPDALEMGPECHKDFPAHSFSHFWATSGFECVSCKRAISTFLFCNSSKVSCLLSLLYSPLTFSFVMFNCVVGTSSVVLNVYVGMIMWF